MNEDFVSYELAVRLKEKGFRELCLAYYTNDDTLYYNYSHKAGASYTDCYISHNLMPKDSVSGKFADAPTIPQVLKWLREEKKIHIEVMFIVPIPNRVKYYITNIGGNRSFMDISDGHYETWEQATLAGIEYVLNKLI